MAVVPSSDAVSPTTVLGDWYANLLFTRPQQLVMCMNERSLLVVLVPAKDPGRLGLRIREAVLELLVALGVPELAATGEALAMNDMAIGATANRRILGCMNDAVLQLSHRLIPGVSLLEHGLHLAGNIYSLTGYQRPGDRVLELLGSAAAAPGVAGTRVLH